MQPWRTSIAIGRSGAGEQIVHAVRQQNPVRSPADSETRAGRDCFAGRFLRYYKGEQRGRDADGDTTTRRATEKFNHIRGKAGTDGRQGEQSRRCQPEPAFSKRSLVTPPSWRRRRIREEDAGGNFGLRIAQAELLLDEYDRP